ncbi:hypothetical protein H6F51_02380 [Cyanobacteria bacterium FACHB-DQ100]|nr:hypothetical protein [Cyanobacteria bacterium FACHB-DQ100]
MCAGHTLENWAILRTVALNVFRLHSFASITQGIWGLPADPSATETCIELTLN